MILVPDIDLPEVSPATYAERLGDPRRLAALRASGLATGEANAVLDRVARLAAGLLGVPIALVSLVDDHRQHFPGMVGLGGWAGAARGTTLSHSFCQHVVALDTTLLISNAAMHPLVMDNLAVDDLDVVAYAGVPLRTTTGESLGALCAISHTPVEWTPEQVAHLDDLAAVAMAEIELRATVRALIAAQRQFADLAGRDRLTGLLNRREFMQRAQEQYARAQQHAAPFGMIVVAVAGFRQLNTLYGEEASDHALIDMAAVLGTVARTADLIGRVGDSDFAMLVPGATATELKTLRDRIEAAVLSLNDDVGRAFPVTVRAGAATWSPNRPESLAAVYLEADARMVADTAFGTRAPHGRAVSTPVGVR